jgi:RimJ/RimL family protein N-acetyltransferase
MFEIRLATFEDISAVIQHDKRHLKEPGFNGSLSHPFLPDHEHDWELRKSEKLLSWTRPLSEERWSRSFIILDGEKILGHIDLRNLFSGTLHRAQLGMGIELSIRGKGHGKSLLKFAIKWAKLQPSLDWIDLSYFAHNTPAQRLYKSCGFIECFTWKDRLRVGPHVIDDTIMTLDLKNNL